MDHVFGVDVDPNALAFLGEVRGVRRKHFRIRDFLDVEPSEFGTRFDVIVGNPPFVRHHLLSAANISKGQARLSQELKVPRTADSWLYFVHHSLQFLRPGGCLAMVLPGALLNAAYAESARRAIATVFGSADLFLVRRRLFADALESPVIVVARGFGERPRGCRLSVVDTAAEIVPAFERRTGRPVDLQEKTGPWRLALLSTRARDVLASITHRRDVAQFGTVANVHIGVVTGANHFFIVSEVDAKERKLPASALRPILGTSKQLSGLVVRNADVRALREGNERVLLLDSRGNKSRWLADYLASDAARDAQAAYKCRKRRVWHDVDDFRVSDAFLTYVIDRGPRLVLNRGAALCTNAVHRVWWRAPARRSTQQGWALSIASTLGGVSAELYGRACGGGALKLEPSEAAALWLPTEFRRAANISEAFDGASTALRQGDWATARELADRAVLRSELGLKESEIADLRTANDALSSLRFSTAARERPRVHTPWST